MKMQDEYNWPDYTPEYAGQLKQMQENDKQDFFITRVETQASGLKFFDNLHPNWMGLYDIIWRMKPASVFECGCGGCYHLKNVQVLLPETELHGCDLLRSQLEYGRGFSSIENATLHELDFTEPLPEFIKTYDLVFSHAVIMHLNTERAKKFLRNMAAISNQFIVLIEGEKNHAGWYDMVYETIPEFTFGRITKYVGNALLGIKKGNALLDVKVFSGDGDGKDIFHMLNEIP